jgi:hypothetical protein
LEETPSHHEDYESIPQVRDLVVSLGKETEPGLMLTEQKVKLWRYNMNLSFKDGEYNVGHSDVTLGLPA